MTDDKTPLPEKPEQPYGSRAKQARGGSGDGAQPLDRQLHQEQSGAGRAGSEVPGTLDVDAAPEIVAQRPDRAGQDGGTKRSNIDESGLQQRIGNYELVRLIGSGAMGQVFLARHHRFAKREYAIKLIRQDAASEQARMRFEREILAMGGLGHPNLVFANDAGIDDDRLYLVMEYVRGQDLQKLIDTQGPFRVPQAAEIVRQICSGVAHAHQHGVMHRDIKPANVLLSYDLQVKVLDLGIASLQNEAASRMTSSGGVMGTAPFIAPELWGNSQAASPASDVYAIACTSYSLCHGNPPFAGDQYQSVLQLMKGHQQDDPIPLHVLRDDVSYELSMVILRALSKDPQRRYQDANELAEAIAPFSEPLTDDVIPDPSAENLSTLIGGADTAPDSVSEQDTKASRTSTSTKVLDEPNVGIGAWVVSFAMLLIAGISLFMAYLGDQVSPAWKLVYGQLGDPQNHEWLGAATDFVLVFIAIPSVCYLLARHYADELRQTLSHRQWGAKTVLVRIALLSALAFLAYQNYAEYGVLDQLPTQLVQETAALDIKTTPGQELNTTRWYLTFVVITSSILPVMTLVFPFLWLMLGDFPKLRSETQSLIDLQSETAYPSRMSENLRRYANVLRGRIGRLLSVYMVAVFALQYNYWIGFTAAHGLRKATYQHDALWMSIALAAGLIFAAAVVIVFYSRAFEVTSRMTAACGSLDDEEGLAKVASGWLLRKIFIGRFSGIACLSIVLVFSHMVYAVNQPVRGGIAEAPDDLLKDGGAEPVDDPSLSAEPEVRGASWIPSGCVPASDATLVTIEARGLSEVLYSRIVFVVGVSDDAEPTGNQESDDITFLLVPEHDVGDVDTPDSFYIMEHKVSKEQFGRFAREFPDQIDQAAAERRRELQDEESQAAFGVTGNEAISFASLVCGGMLPTPQQWDAAFGRFYDPSLLETTIHGFEPVSVNVATNSDISPWGCFGMSAGGLEFTRYDTQWKRLAPHNQPTHSLQLRGRVQFSEDGPLRLEDWDDLPENLLFGSRPVDEPSDDVGFRVVLIQKD